MLTFTYFKFNYGLALPARVACELSGVEYKMNEVAGESWPAMKGSKDAPFGVLPTMTTENGEVVSQSQAILYYIGKKGDLMYGEDALMNARVLEVCNAIVDIMKLLGPSMQEKDAAKKKEMREKVFSETYPAALNLLDKHVAQHGKKAAVGDKCTIADVMICCMHMSLQNPNLEHCKPDLVMKYSSLKKVVDSVLANTKVADMIKSFSK
eukprot:Lankesteria_metandrocarpae@DN5388_c0_g1_i4.p1